MKDEYANPFIQATLNVIKTMAFTEAKAGKPYVKKQQEALGDVTGIIGVTGDAKGSMSVTFSLSSIEAILGKMFSEPVSGITEEVKDAVGEITNMICGDARGVLDTMGFSLVAAIPTVVSGHNHNITHMVSGPTLAIPFETDAGPFTVEIALND